MIDRLVMAARMDFSSMLIRPSIKVRNALVILIISILLLATCNVFFSMSQVNINNGIEQIKNYDFSISDGKINIDSEQMQQLNNDLRADGITIESKKIIFARNDTVSFQQLLLFSGQESLDNQEVLSLLHENSALISGLIFFYFYLKELITFFWVIILAIVLSRTTQKYLRQRVQLSFRKTFDCVTSLATLPLFACLLLNSFGVKWSMRLLIITMIYTILAFIFARYSLTNIKIKEEKE